MRCGLIAKLLQREKKRLAQIEIRDAMKYFPTGGNKI
jgi:hypothetical protein